jgi:hypothetical protein
MSTLVKENGVGSKDGPSMVERNHPPVLSVLVAGPASTLMEAASARI